MRRGGWRRRLAAEGLHRGAAQRLVVALAAAHDAAAREPSRARGGARPRPAGSAGYMVHGLDHYVVSSV